MIEVVVYVLLGGAVLLVLAALPIQAGWWVLRNPRKFANRGQRRGKRRFLR